MTTPDPPVAGRRTSPMRIAIAIERYDPKHGGAERSTDQIARALATRGHEITIIAGGAPPDPSLPAYVQGRVQRWRGERKPRTGRDAERFRAWAVDRLHSGAFDTSLSVTTLIPARLVEPRAGVVRENMARALVAMGGSSRAGARGWRRLGQRLSLRKRSLLRAESATFRDPRVHRFVAISRYMRQQMIDHYATAPGRIAVVPNACDAPPIPDDQRCVMRNALRDRHEWPAETPLVLFPALDARRKGLAPLLRAMATLVLTVPNVRLLVAGRLPAWGTSLANTLGMAERVETLGVVEQMAEVYAAADVTVMPTYYDPASRIVVESLLAGTPVITTRFDGSADWIDSDDKGRVINDPDDTPELARAIEQVLAGRAVPTARPTIDATALHMNRHVDELERLFAQTMR